MLSSPESTDVLYRILASYLDLSGCSCVLSYTVDWHMHDATELHATPATRVHEVLSA